MTLSYARTSTAQPGFKRQHAYAIGGILALASSLVLAYLMIGEDASQVLSRADLASIRTGDAIIEVHGNGARPLHIFESVDCTFCRKLEPELAKLENVTIYRHLLPGHTAAARATTEQVWCAHNPVEAWHTAIQGKMVFSSRCASDALDRNHALGNRLGITRTPAMVFASGRVLIGLADSADMSEALEKK